MKAKGETNDRRLTDDAKQKRKIVQIAISHLLRAEDDTDSLYALCDDGTLWFNSWEEGTLMEWERLKAIPQD